jgi:Domain of unknown function (DUF4394)
MFKRLTAAALVAAAAAALAVAPESAGASRRYDDCATGHATRRSVDVVGLTRDRHLICFRSNHPEWARDQGKVRGLTTDRSLVGIDVRPATGDLYGLGDQGGVYTIDPDRTRATLVSRANMALRGTNFGVDFNPVADRLRVVSDVGQSLRINVADGTTTADTDVAYTPGTPATGVVGSMYTNNDADPNTGTTLFDVDSTLDQLAIQSPPNAGNLVATGKLGADTGPEVGADIYSRLEDGTTVSNWAFVSLSDNLGSHFARVNLLTGRATPVDDFSWRYDVTGIAVLPPTDF